MDLSAIIVVVFCILVFFGGAAWIESRSRKEKRRDGRGGRSPHAAPTANAGRAGYGRAAEGE